MAKRKDYRTVNVSPLRTGIRNFSTILNFYLYYAPNIDSCQSMGRIEGANAENVFEEMLICTHIKEKTKILKKIQPLSWRTLDFETNEIDFEDSRMLFDKYNNESNLTALLRHIRNSFAHGYVYVWKKKRGNYIFLIDYDKNKNKITAKILVSMSILERWKAIIENQIMTGE